ncbi:MAG: DUF3015 domain-containing protein [Nitrospira sp.]|nr:MAG: DUF3015 domain-containing protein [Nitrospira sp.]
MLKKLVVALGTVAVISQAGLALAANPDTGPGCGLGKLAWADFKHQKNILPQVLMVTTNGTGMNTFAISSGTSGCTNDGQVWASERANVFAAINLENLSQDMAQGKGEHLASLASLMGIPDEQHGAFFALTQERYSTFLQEGETSSVALVKALNEAVAKNPVLAQAVAR